MRVTGSSMDTESPSAEREPTMDEKSPAPRGMYGQRPSKSADWARRRLFEEMAAMTPRERVLLALSLKERSRLIREGVSRAQNKSPPSK